MQDLQLGMTQKDWKIEKKTQKHGGGGGGGGGL